MKKTRSIVLAVALVGLAITVLAFHAAASDGEATYSVTATAIEGCSCPLFCSCYYNTEPTGGHKCQFNNAYRFEEGSHWGDVDLSGGKIWVSGDLGGHFGDGTTEWAVVSLDKNLTEEQRQAVGGWINTVFPVQWGSVEMREDEITWEDNEETAHAMLASGLAKIKLDKVFDAHGNQSVVNNTAYWAADSNTGFRLAKSTHEYTGDENSYAYEGRNGFLITLTAEGVVPAAGD